MGIAVGADGVGPLIVSKEKDDVGALSSACYLADTMEDDKDQ